jgi:hypothetical protein
MMMGKQPRMVAVVALANKIARAVWALTVGEATCRARAAARAGGRAGEVRRPKKGQKHQSPDWEQPNKIAKT